MVRVWPLVAWHHDYREAAKLMAEAAGAASRVCVGYAIRRVAVESVVLDTKEKGRKESGGA